MNTNPFSKSTYDLGTDNSIGYSAEDISAEIKHTAYTQTHICVVCGGTPKYKLVAKLPEHNTAQVQKGVAICQHCVDKKAIDPQYYGLRQL